MAVLCVGSFLLGVLVIVELVGTEALWICEGFVGFNLVNCKCLYRFDSVENEKCRDDESNIIIDVRSGSELELNYI